MEANPFNVELNPKWFLYQDKKVEENTSHGTKRVDNTNINTFL